MDSMERFFLAWTEYKRREKPELLVRRQSFNQLKASDNEIIGKIKNIYSLLTEVRPSKVRCRGAGPLEMVLDLINAAGLGEFELCNVAWSVETPPTISADLLAWSTLRVLSGLL